MKKIKGFTLVEVLICVGIIGIIAAITIPVLLTSTSEKALEAQRKAFQSRTAQAFAQIKNLKNYEQSTLTGSTYTDNYSALNFISTALSSVFKMSSTCDATQLSECGIPAVINDYYTEKDLATYNVANKTTLPLLNSNISAADDLDNFVANFAGFKTVNGVSALLWYNPRCKSKSEISPHNLAHSVCVNIIYDLNGKNSPPNAYGEDIGFITVFYPSDSQVVMPIMYNKELFTAGKYSDMLTKAAELNLVPPTIEELVSILINKDIAHISSMAPADKQFWSSSYSTSNIGQVWTAGLTEGIKTEDISGSAATDKQYFLLVK